MSAGDKQNFPNTNWALVRQLKSPDSATASRALEDLCAQYYYPLYCVIRSRGLERDDAQDALHDFLAKLVRVRALEGADAERGRLRAFLGTALQRFLVNWNRDHAYREREVSLDFTPPGEEAEQRFREERFTAADTPERIFDRKWGLELLQSVLRRLGEKYAARDRAALFEGLRPVLLAGGSLRDGDTTEIAAALSMSEGAVRVALSRLLGEYRAILEEEVSHTVESRAEVQQEIAHLFNVFHAA